MNRLARWTMLLYPARWRRRYGNEVEALVDDAGADARVVADLLQGAVRMQFSTWSFPRLAAVLGLVGMLVGLAFSFLTPVQYVARAELPLAGADSVVFTMQMLESMVTSRASLASVINDPKFDLYRDERKVTPLEDVIQRMRRGIVFRPHGPKAFAIQFTYPDKAKAQAAVQAMAEQAAEQLRNSTAASRNHINPNAIEVIDPATLPTAPLRPELLPMALGGLAAGLLFAVLWQLKSSRRRYLSLSVAGAVAGVAMAFLIPSIAGIFPDDFTLLRYASHATMYCERADAVPGLAMEASSRSAMAALINDPRDGFYRSQFKTYTLDDFIVILHRDLVITTRGDGGNGRFIDISFTYSNPHKSQLTVNAVMNRITEDNQATRRHANPAPARQTQWGDLAPGSETQVAVDTVSPNRAAAMIPGLLAGLALAAIIAMVRRRWVPAEEDEPVVPRKSGTLKFNRARFRKFAIRLAAAGAICGTVIAVLAPARYVSDALVSFDNASPSRVAILINDAVDRGIDGAGRARRNLSWQQVESGGAKTDAYRIQFVADDPVRARTVVQDVLGDLDRAITNLHGGDENPFEEIRGVDGALLPYLDSLVSIPATEPPGKIAISFDDEHAKAVPQPQFRAVRMNLIDPPVQPSHSEGIGWWSVAIGTLSGLALAFLFSLIGGIGDWFAATRPDAIAGASTH
jgi:capsular polysaccharide biosynthesis protein